MAIVLDGNNLNTSGLVNCLPPQSIISSGAYTDITGIPSTANRVVVVAVGLSLSAADNFSIQLGYSGGVATTGYVTETGFYGSTTSGSTATSGFNSYGWASAANSIDICLTLYHMGSNQWFGTALFGVLSQNYQSTITGKVTLAGALDRVRFTSSAGSGTVDAGTARIFYE